MVTKRKKKAAALTKADIRDVVRDVMKKEEEVTKSDVELAVNKALKDITLKEDMWKDAVKEGVEAAVWDVAGYGVVATFLLMVTGIIIASFIFAFLGYVVLGAAFPLP